MRLDPRFPAGGAPRRGRGSSKEGDAASRTPIPGPLGRARSAAFHPFSAGAPSRNAPQSLVRPRDRGIAHPYPCEGPPILVGDTRTAKAAETAPGVRPRTNRACAPRHVRPSERHAAAHPLRITAAKQAARGPEPSPAALLHARSRRPSPHVGPPALPLLSRLAGKPRAAPRGVVAARGFAPPADPALAAG